MLEKLDEAILFLKTCDDETRLKQAHLGNALAAIKTATGENSWVGLYLATPTDLILGPFQGTHACEVIAFGKGVVGACFSQDKTIAVEDVSLFPGYICCDASAKSEICIPLRQEGRAIAVLDIDLPFLHRFTSEETKKLEEIAAYLPHFL